ncbi:amidohydrolase [Fulvivirga maritima]|uniref:M20 metallopeptidase family protein n=1 Tax=Fulvivirga maritima TaxID=2904247 RepID=UPI001F410116|nr:amidohydrolase [Fulvivirga maritima]UII25173.1 amidohydrolase [Fulvivirga maritima]
MRAQNNELQSVHTAIQLATDSLYKSLVEIRRDIHLHPELSGEEKRTSEFIYQYLTELGLEVKRGIGGYSVIGILQGAQPGKKIAWRADIDAIPVHNHGAGEAAAKKEEMGHNCGHDVHTTIGLGIANVLTKQKDQIKGTIYFIFQPSEENYKGAKMMIDDGLFNVISPEEIYAAHISPMPAGLIASKPGYLFADYKQINMTFKATEENDEIAGFVKKKVAELQNVEPDSKFWDNRNLMDPNIGIGNPNTIFKDFVTAQKQFKVEENDGELKIIGFISASNEERINAIPDQLKATLKESKYGHLLKDVYYYSKMIGYSTERGNIDNDEHLTLQTINTVANIYGPASAIQLYGIIPDGRGDDFSYFQQQVPGTYFLMGGSNFEKGIIAMPHSPNFSVDESCIKSGVKYFASMLVEQVNKTEESVSIKD